MESQTSTAVNYLGNSSSFSLDSGFYLSIILSLILSVVVILPL